MSDIPQINISGVNRPAASWQKKTTNHANANQFARSKGHLLTQTPYGTTIDQTRQHKINPILWNYIGEFNYTASASPMDVCRVLPGVDYHVSASVGTWICVAPVPGQDLSDAIVSTYGSGQYTQWVRQLGVQYFPVSPESSSIADSPGAGRYWEQIGASATGSNAATGSVNYRSDYDASTTYFTGDVVRLQDGSINAGLWINVAPHGSTGVSPVFPEPKTTGGTNTWDLWTLGVNVTTVCGGGTSTNVYINSTPPPA